MQCAEWFNHINHGLKIVDYVQFSICKESESMNQNLANLKESYQQSGDKK